MVERNVWGKELTKTDLLIVPDEFQPCLDADEEVLWIGQPRQGLLFAVLDFYLVPFMMLWLSFVLTFIYFSLRDGAPMILISLFGVPAFMAGLFLLVGRFFLDARSRKLTSYALTSKRALIATGIFSRSVRTIELRHLDQVSFSSRANGYGTISFGANLVPTWIGESGWPGASSKSAPMFKMIPNAKVVYATLKQAQTEFF